MKFPTAAIIVVLASYPFEMLALEGRSGDLQEQTAPDKKPPKPNALPAPPSHGSDPKTGESKTSPPKKSAKKAKKEDKVKEKK